MELLKESGERKWWLVKKWTTKAGLEAMVNKCEWGEKVKALAPSLHDFYTGYVRIPELDNRDYYNNQDGIEVHGGITFQDKKEGEEGTWVGFDLAHYGDENLVNGEAYATDECESLAEQIKKINE